MDAMINKSLKLTKKIQAIYIELLNLEEMAKKKGKLMELETNLKEIRGSLEDALIYTKILVGELLSEKILENWEKTLKKEPLV